MRTLTTQEKRTIRIGGIGLACYLVLFFGFKTISYLQASRHNYRQMVADAEKLRGRLQLYQEKAEWDGMLMKTYQMDPAKLVKTKVVADASAAIQQAALSSGIQLGPVRESPGQPQSKELSTIQFEGMGQVPVMLTFLQRLNTLGYPLIVDSVQFSSDPRRPGGLKMNLTIVVLDFEQWKAEEVPHA